MKTIAMNISRPSSTLRNSIALCAVLLIASGAQAKDNKKAASDNGQATLSQAFVMVNGEIQSNARAEVLLREQLARGATDSPELRNGVREVLVNQAMMAQEARKASLDKNPLVQAQIELAQQNILAVAWQQKVLGETRITDAEIKTEYDLQIARMGNQEYLVRHLLVADEATALQLTERIKGGVKMADLATENSRDNETKGRGGLTDWTVMSNFLPPVAEAVAKLEKGKLSPQPVKTAQGWHVLQLEDKRAFTPPTLEASKTQIANVLARQALEAKAATLKKQVRVQ
jgi:peptidyl-prolyl cis-trans isomerase C